MRTKMIIAVAFMIMVQLSTAKAQISTNIESGNSGSNFSINIGTKPNLIKPTLSTNTDRNNNNLNSCCNSTNSCNPKANCCGQKHGNKKHKHKKHDCGNDNRNGSNNNNKHCCKKHDD